MQASRKLGSPIGPFHLLQVHRNVHNSVGSRKDSTSSMISTESTPRISFSESMTTWARMLANPKPLCATGGDQHINTLNNTPIHSTNRPKLARPLQIPNPSHKPWSTLSTNARKRDRTTNQPQVSEEALAHKLLNVQIRLGQLYTQFSPRWDLTTAIKFLQFETTNNTLTCIFKWDAFQA